MEVSVVHSETKLPYERTTVSGVYFIQKSKVEDAPPTGWPSPHRAR